MIKRIFLLMLLTLALPIATFASSVDFTNSGGTLTGSTSLSLSGSVLIHVGTIVGSDLGSLTFSTGALTSGTLQMGGTLGAGGSFVITGNGADGVHNGVIFSGSFSAPSTWTLVTLGDGTHNYTLSGTMTGTWFTGQKVSGATVELTTNTGTGFFTSGSTSISSGDTSISGIGVRSSTPEPSSLVFFGTGLVGMASVWWRKKRS